MPKSSCYNCAHPVFGSDPEYVTLSFAVLDGEIFQYKTYLVIRIYQSNSSSPHIAKIIMMPFKHSISPMVMIFFILIQIYLLTRPNVLVG